MKFAVATVAFWISVGLDPTNWRKSLDGKKAICHVTYAEKKGINLYATPGVDIYDSVDTDFESLLRSPEWLEKAETGDPDSFSLLNELNRFETKINTAVSQKTTETTNLLSPKIEANKQDLLAAKTQLEQKTEKNKQDIAKTEQNLNAQLTQTNADLAVERERITTLSALDEGSTTGDAELMDVRIGALGNIYPNAAEATRGQIKNVLSLSATTKTFNMSNNGVGLLLSMEKELYKGQTIEFALEDPGDIVDKNINVSFGVLGVDGLGIDNIAKLKVGEIGTFTLPKDCKALRCWVPGSAKIGTGTVTMSLNYKKGLYDTLNAIDSENKKIASSMYGDSGVPFVRTTHNATAGYDVNIRVNGDFKKGQEVIFEFISGNLFAEDTKIHIGVQFETRYADNVILLTPNQKTRFVFPENATTLIIWVNKVNVLNSGMVSFTTNFYYADGLYEKILSLSNEIGEANKHLSYSQSFSIIGDSYSTYEGWIPDDYTAWYSDDYTTQTSGRLDSAMDTWWWQLSKEKNLRLLFNSSRSGSTICNTGYEGGDATATSFITRAKKDIGEKRAMSPKPDVIFIFGGTNDSWTNAPVGVVKYSGWTEDDLKTVLPAFCYLIDYLKAWNPGARIINLVNTGLKTSITQGMATACQYYGVENLVLSEFSKEGGHPDKNGMANIKNQVLELFM